MRVIELESDLIEVFEDPEDYLAGIRPGFEFYEHEFRAWLASGAPLVTYIYRIVISFSNGAIEENVIHEIWER